MVVIIIIMRIRRIIDRINQMVNQLIDNQSVYVRSSKDGNKKE